MRTFARGWMPDADADGGPKDALLRMDNGILDELGVVSSRLGSQPINASPLDDTSVHSLYTIVLNGTRERMVGAGNSVYANGAEILGAIPGSTDIPFGSHLGQIFFARSTTKRKYDGTDVTNWGIAMTGTAPSSAVAGDDTKTFASFDSTESPAFSEDFGDGTAFVAGFDGTGNGAIQVTWDATHVGSSITKTFATPQDFTVYDNGNIGADTDQIELWVKIESGQLPTFTEVDLFIDLGGSVAFVSDYYWYRKENTEDSGFIEGWNLVSAPRSAFMRVGNNNALSWATVKAVRVTSGGSAAGNLVSYDRCRIRGGTQSPVTGTVRYKYIYVRDTGTYIIKSAPSAVSNDLIVSANATAVTIPADATRDTQADEIWLYRQGGGLDEYYRVATSDLPAGFSYTLADELAILTATFPSFDPMPQAFITAEFERPYLEAITPGFAALSHLSARDRTTADTTFDAIVIVDQMSDADALVLNITLNDTIDVPPDDILAIEGPYFDRMYVLTSTDLYPSQPLGPDMFSVDEVIHIADETETALWLKKAFDGLYIGTTKDIYRLSGTGNPLDDGTLDFTLQPLNIDVPPINQAVASDNTFLVYMGADGWRAVAGQSGSTRIVGPTSLLYRGQTRHGVEPVNLAGRVRATIAHGQLVAVTPEGDSTTSSPVLYRYVLGTDGQRWYRHPYPTSWMSVAREPDGTLIAGDNAGTAWTLDDVGRLDDEDGIDVELWTVADDADAPLQRKIPHDVRFVCDTQEATATMAVHLNDSVDADLTVTGETATMTSLTGSLSTLAAADRFQFRLTVTANEFGARVHGYDIGATLLPRPFRGRFDNSNLSIPADKTVTGFTLRLCTLGETRTFSVIVDGETADTFTITTGNDQPETHTAALETALTGTDWALSVDGDIELYSYEPIVTTAAPRGVKTYDSGPMDLGQEFTWVRELRIGVNATADLTAVLWFDGIQRDTVTLTVPAAGPRVLTVPVPRDFKGSMPRLVLSSTATFYPEWIDVVRRTSGARLDAKPVRINAKAAA